MTEAQKQPSHGQQEAREIIGQSEKFIDAAKLPENAATLNKLRDEDFTDAEQAKGENLLQQARNTLAGSRAAPASSEAATMVRIDARTELMDEFSRRLKKTRGKLKEDKNNGMLLDVLNHAVRSGGRSCAALTARVDAFMNVVDKPIQLPGAAQPVTIAQVVNFRPDQRRTLEDKRIAYRQKSAQQNVQSGDKQKHVADKDEAVDKLDRWLAKWQDVAKADFSDAELEAFGIPTNLKKSRRRKPEAEDKAQGPTDCQSPAEAQSSTDSESPAEE